MLIRRLGLDIVGLQNVSATEAEMRERSKGCRKHGAGMVKNLLEFVCCLATAISGQISSPSHEHGIQTTRHS